MKKIHFFDLLGEAWQATRTEKTPWIFGFFVALSGVTISLFNENFLHAQSIESLSQLISHKTLWELGFFAFILFFLFLVNVFGTGNLIPALSFMIKKRRPENYPASPRVLLRNFVLTFLVECLIFFSLLVVLGILSLPLLIASKFNPETLSLLQSLALFVFLPLALALSVVKQFALFYLLLSPLRFRPALEAACSLFSRFFIPSFFFVSVLIVLTLLFTFFVNLVILASTVLFENIPLPLGKTSFAFAISLLLFLWFSVFEKALWIAFFKSIASPYDTEKMIADKEASILEKNILPETPSAQ